MAWHRYVNHTYPYVQSPEAKRGDEFHIAIEGDLKGISPYNYELNSPLVRMLDTVKAQNVIGVELKLAIDLDGKQCRWYDARAWARGKLDCVIQESEQSYYLIDWKTGKKKEDPEELEFHAMLLRPMIWPHAKIQGFYVWLDANGPGQTYDLSETQATLDATRQREEHIREMGTGEWRPHKNYLCAKHCDVLSCQYNGRRDSGTDETRVCENNEVSRQALTKAEVPVRIRARSLLPGDP